MFQWSPGEFKTGYVILEARAFRIQSQNFNLTRFMKNSLLFHNGTVLEYTPTPGTKGVLIKIDHISMCQLRARALRDFLARYRDLHLQRPTI